MPEKVRISYAQNGEDVRAWRALRHVENGFYVEVGASHPFDHSLTAALSEEGWSGVLVEPEPAAADLLRSARPRDHVVPAAATSRPGVVHWSNAGDRGEGQVSRSGSGLVVPAVRVGDLLADVAPEAVHFMSVDVEGHEREALIGADLERWRPWVLCIESTAPLTRTQTHMEWENLVLAAGYVYAAFDGLNRWYVSPDHSNLAVAISEPFSVLDEMLDGWRRAQIVDMERRHHEALAEIERIRQEHAHQVAELAASEAGRQDAEQQRRELLSSLEQARSAHAEEQRTAVGAASQIVALTEQLGAVVAERDAALAREHVLLTSKSWKLTRPLRRARLSARMTLRNYRGQPSVAASPELAGPIELRRRAALIAKVTAARRRVGL